MNVGRIICDRLGDTEIDELEAIPNQNKVGRLQIRVDDPLFMNDMNCFKHLLKVIHDIMGHSF